MGRQVRYKGRKLPIKERFRDGSARPLNARPLGVNQRGLNVGVAATVAHVRNRRKRTRLDVKRAALSSSLFHIYAKTRVRVNGGVVVTKAFATKQRRVDVLDASGGRLLGNQVGHLVFAGTARIAIVLRNFALVIVGAGEFINPVFASGDGDSARERSDRHFFHDVRKIVERQRSIKIDASAVGYHN